MGLSTGYMGKADIALAAPGTAYQDLFPYHAEFCALSEFRKKPGFGAELSSGMGGHAVLYLNGVRLDHAARYPVLRLCAPDEAPEQHGAGISVNEHYRNANWIAVEGRDFLMRGALAEGEPLTRESYARTQARAQAMGIFEGVEFHPHLFRDKPHGMSDCEYMYEISVASDYGVRFGRDAFCARVPLDHARMGAIVDYLNALNQPYREGRRIYNWKIFNNNCVHVGHNALAAAGVWAPWPTGQSPMLAAFKFPVPKNTFVDLMLRANDLPLEDPQALYQDRDARAALLRWGALPVGPGALAVAEPAVARNEIYDVARRLRLIFYDNPFWGPYRFRFRRIFADPRYTDLRANLRHFAARYAAARRAKGPHNPFNARYEAHIALAAAQTEAMLTKLGETP